MKIITRKKRNKNYFYLIGSFRRNGKVITKEKYIGAEIPNNIEEIRKEFRKQIRVDLYKKLGIIKNNFQAEWRKIPESAKQKEKEEISIAFTYNTNAIEGSTITLE